MLFIMVIRADDDPDDDGPDDDGPDDDGPDDDDELDDDDPFHGGIYGETSRLNRGLEMLEEFGGEG